MAITTDSAIRSGDGVRSSDAVEHGGPRIDGATVSAYRVPTNQPESDGTLRWSSTGMVVVEVEAGGMTGLGYAYTTPSAAGIVRDTLLPAIQAGPALDVPRLWHAMRASIRNLGAQGVASSAIAAVDVALWDVKARLLGIPLALLLGRARDDVPVYGSGGFTSYGDHELVEQLAGWAEAGIERVKMKVGRRPEDDPARVAVAREAIGPEVGLMVDANGGYARKQALRLAEAFAEHGVVWFEEPVSSDDLNGLRLLRDRAPAGMEITAGEYGYDLAYFQRMLDADVVDVLMADASRCRGITGFLRVATLCDGAQMPLSAHTAPALHLHAALAAPGLRDLEWFHDHARIERLFFDGAQEPRDGVLRPDLSRLGHGLALKRGDAADFLVGT
jgi:L-alanine-DL-glutamate epimerase-like enolase superfamily enzyme